MATAGILKLGGVVHVEAGVVVPGDAVQLVAGGELVQQTRDNAGFHFIGDVVVQRGNPAVVDVLLHPGVVQLDHIVGTAAGSQIGGQAVSHLIPAHQDQFDFDSGLSFKLAGLFLVEADGVHLVAGQDHGDLLAGCLYCGSVRGGGVCFAAASGQQTGEHCQCKNQTDEALFHICSS